MTAGMRKQGRKLEVTCESIRSLCSHTQCISDAVLKDLQKGYLRAYLKCLAKVIEQQLSSLMTFSMSFSWRLPRAVYPYEVRRETSLFSMVDAEIGERFVQGPMKVLDDLSICWQRALLRLQPHLPALPTQMQELGKSLWSKKRGEYEKIIRDTFKDLNYGFDVRDIWLEHPVVLSYIDKEVVILLRGIIDLILICFKKVGETESIPLIILFEFTMHENISDIISRVVAYSSGMYSTLGLYTIPVIAVVKDYEECLINDFLIITNRKEEFGISSELLSSFKLLKSLIMGKKSVNRPSYALCFQCDVDIRRICPLIK
ncbi:MAG: hypothetical protein QXF33_01310 [Sulfolobales archaeon]